jgi:hypothetical protein
LLPAAAASEPAPAAAICFRAPALSALEPPAAGPVAAPPPPEPPFLSRGPRASLPLSVAALLLVGSRTVLSLARLHRLCGRWCVTQGGEAAHKPSQNQVNPVVCRVLNHRQNCTTHTHAPPGRVRQAHQAEALCEIALLDAHRRSLQRGLLRQRGVDEAELVLQALHLMGWVGTDRRTTHRVRLLRESLGRMGLSGVLNQLPPPCPARMRVQSSPCLVLLSLQRLHARLQGLSHRLDIKHACVSQHAAQHSRAQHASGHGQASYTQTRHTR